MTVTAYAARGIDASPHRSTVGDLGALRDTLTAARRVLWPVVVRHPDTNALVLLAGERRFAALLRDGRESTYVYVVRFWREFLAWMMVDQTEPGEKRPMTLIEAAVFAEKAMLLLRPGTADGAMRTIAEYLAIDYEHLRGAVYVLRRTGMEYPEPVRARAHELLDLLNAGKLGPSAANDRLSKLTRQLDSGIAVMSAARQRRALDSTFHLLAGVTDGLVSLGELSRELTAEECQHWAAAFGVARAQIERTIRALRERTK